MKLTIGILLAAAFPLGAQTTVYLRSSAPAAVPICGATNTTPVVVQTCSPHGYSGGWTVINAGVCTGGGPSPVNGIRVVNTVVDATHFSINNLSGNPIAGNGAYTNCDPLSGSPGAQWTGKLTAYTLGSQPLGWLDGLNGTVYRKLALGTQNGLATSGGLVVSGSTATVTTTYTNGMATGDKVGIWGTTSSALNNSGNPYTVTVTGPTTFTFPTSGVSGGDYTMNPACGPASPPNDTIGGAANCVRISQLAYTGNAFWDAVNYYSGTGAGINTGTAYKYVFDGGSQYPDVSQSQPMAGYSLAAVRFLVDQSNSQMLSVVTYALNHLSRMAGVNWTVNELAANAGGNGGGAMNALPAVSWLYLAGASYVAPAEKITVLNTIYNNLDDPSVTACSKTDADLSTGHNKALNSGTATGGGATTITLASSASSTNSYYNNNIVAATVSGNTSYGLVTSYVGSTRVATVGSWSNGSPSSGTAYTVYATISISSAAAGATAIITGYNTAFVSDGVAQGDAVFGANGWGGIGVPVELAESYVSVAVSSNTSLTVVNSQYPPTSSTPQMYWHIPQIKTGDCGMYWYDEHWPGFMGAQPLLYPPAGGSLTLNGGPGPVEGGNNGVPNVQYNTILGLVTAPDDSRAVSDLAMLQSQGFDYELRHYMNYMTGTAHSGAYYTFINILPFMTGYANALAMSIPTFPSMDLTGNWMQTQSLYKMFSVLPDFRYEPGDGIRTGWATRFGTENSGVDIQYQLGGQWVTDGAFLWSPTSNNAKYLRNWLQTTQTQNLWGQWGTSAVAAGWQLVQNDPRIGSSDFTVQPHQYLFQATSAAACASLTGWPCPANFRGDVVISRTGWSRYNDTQTAGPSDTFLYYGSRMYYYDHDTPQNGTMLLYKAGELLATDFNPPNDEYASNNSDQTTMGFMLQLGGSNATVALANGIQGGYSPIIRWASANHGSWVSAYGDQNSAYMYTCSDLSGVYTAPSNYIQRCVAHLKQSGNDEFVLQWDTASVTSPISGGIATHIHYPQTGESGVSAYPEGTTTCPGTGGCSSLNTSRAVQELETGTADEHGDPTPNFGLVTNYLSPGTITVRWDGSTYSGANGHTDRVSVCAGSSCGSSASVFESLIVHKVVTRGLTDTSLNCTGIIPDANWFVAQCAGAISPMVFAGARGGTTYSTIAGFTTTHAGTAQYLIGGLTAGTYQVTVNGSQVSGSPFTVGANDNSIEFLSASGAVSINGSAGGASGSGSILSGKATTSGNVVIH